MDFYKIMYENRRKTNYWEPIYDPVQQDLTKQKISEEDFDNKTGWKNSIISLTSFLSAKNKYQNYTFETIDFIDELIPEKTKTITFNNCVFKNVSFIGTIFENIKFQKCKFEKTTFSLSTFNNCEFRDCEYKDVGISGNTTIFNDCYIDSQKLLKNVFLNRDKELLKEKKTTLLYQNFRHVKTKSIIARKIMTMSPVRNDLSMLIRTISIARNYETKASILEEYYNLVIKSVFSKIPHLFSFIFFILEFMVINLFGWLTGWGHKIGKTAFIGISCIIIFSFIYKYYVFENELYIQQLLKSFEYWFLIGYTKYKFDDLSIPQQLVIFCNSFLGLLWYASLIPIIFNKMSKDDK